MAVAGRLSEDPSIAVAVLEAGMNVEDLPEVLLVVPTSLLRIRVMIHYADRN